MGIREQVKSKSITKDEAIDIAESWLKKEPWNFEKIGRLIKWINKR